MKAKNTHGLLARILVVLMAMVLIVSCTTVVLAEDAAEQTDKPFVIVVDEPKSAKLNLSETIAASLEEAGISQTTFLPTFKALPGFSQDENSGMVAVFFDESGGTFLNLEKHTKTDVLFFLDAFILQFDTSPNEQDRVYWAYVLFDHVVNGEQVYVYASNSFSTTANATRYLITTLLETDYSGLGFEVTPVEDEEGLYQVKSLETENVGYLHAKILDMPVEEVIPMMVSDLTEVLTNY